MHVLAVLPLYPPGSRVGAWLTTHEFLAHLARRGHHVTAIPFLSGGFRPYVLDGVHVLPPVALVHGEPYEFADVVVSHLWDDSRAHSEAKRRGLLSVRMIHSSNMSVASCLRGVDLAVFNSNWLLRGSGYRGPAIVCRPPVRAADYATTPGDRITLVNLSVAKGANVFWTVAKSMPKTKFLGVRGGYGRQVIHKRANVEIVGTTSNMRDDVYARTRILLMPSREESYGRVAAEAICSGIPVIAHPAPGLVEVLGDAGIFVNRNEPAKWRDAILRLSDPDKWAAASEKCLARSATLDPTEDLDRFADAMEVLVAARTAA